MKIFKRIKQIVILSSFTKSNTDFLNNSDIFVDDYYLSYYESDYSETPLNSSILKNKIKNFTLLLMDQEGHIDKVLQDICEIKPNKVSFSVEIFSTVWYDFLKIFNILSEVPKLVFCYTDLLIEILFINTDIKIYDCFEEKSIIMHWDYIKLFFVDFYELNKLIHSTGKNN